MRRFFFLLGFAILATSPSLAMDADQLKACGYSSDTSNVPPACLYRTVTVMRATVRRGHRSTEAVDKPSGKVLSKKTFTMEHSTQRLSRVAITSSLDDPGEDTSCVVGVQFFGGYLLVSDNS